VTSTNKAAAAAAEVAAAANFNDPTQQSSANASGAGRERSFQSKERMFDIESASLTTAQPPETFHITYDTISDPIACATCSDKFLVIARKSGTITRFTIPHLSQENTYTTRCEPFRIELNCTSTKLGLVDSVGTFSLLDLEARIEEGEEVDGKAVLGTFFGRKLGLERRDVWDIKWAEVSYWL
jgi:hypothetical protein